MVDKIIAPNDEELIAMMGMTDKEREAWVKKQLEKLEKEGE